MDLFNNLLLGLSLALETQNIFFIIFGVFWGIIAGAVPGLTAAAGIALVLPFTFYMDSVSAMVFLAGIWTGGMYGGSITAILMNTPGSIANIATLLDGHPLHKKGKSGKALSIALIYSSFAGILTTFLLILLAEPLANYALKFGPAEKFALTLFGLSAVSSIAGGKDQIKGLISCLLGLMISTIGSDFFTGEERYTGGKDILLDGFNIIAILVGLFAFPEILKQIANFNFSERINIKFNYEFATFKEIVSCIKSGLIGSFIGMIVGIMPGAGGSIASLIGWSEAKRWSKNKDDFGKGTLEGVAASESANNADIQGALVPTVALGIPGSVSATLMLSALILHGLRPGPMLFTQRPDVVYGLFAGLFLSNIVLLIVGFFIIKSAIKIINTNPPFLLSTILIIIITGVFKINHEIFDIFVALMFGFLGIIMNKYNFSTAALSLGIVLGKLFEISFRQALTISSGDPLIFINRPISLFLIIISIITLMYPILFKKKE